MTVKKRDFLQIFKFGLVGTFNTLLDYGMFYVFFGLCNFNKNPAQVLSTAISMTNSYLVNRYWTFEKTGPVSGKEVCKFLVVNLLSLGTTLLCLNWFHDVFYLHRVANNILEAWGASFMLAGDFEVMFCKLVAIPFAWVVNFLGNRLWVFGAKSGEKAA